MLLLVRLTRVGALSKRDSLVSGGAFSLEADLGTRLSRVQPAPTGVIGASQSIGGFGNQTTDHVPRSRKPREAGSGTSRFRSTRRLASPHVLLRRIKIWKIIPRRPVAR